VQIHIRHRPKHRGLRASAEPTKSRLRKEPTSSVVEGPPMFMNTIAVGPMEPADDCVTGGAWVVTCRAVMERPFGSFGVMELPEAARDKVSGSFAKVLRRAIGGQKCEARARKDQNGVHMPSYFGGWCMRQGKRGSSVMSASWRTLESKKVESATLSIWGLESHCGNRYKLAPWIRNTPPNRSDIAGQRV
jgi:hypothetical protein